MTVVRRVLGELADLTVLDGVSAGLRRLARGALRGRPQMADALRGTWLGHPLHPAVVAVPIGAWTSSLLLGFLPRHGNAPRTLAGLGLLTAPTAAVTGLADWSELDDEQRRVGLVHAGTTLAGAWWYLAAYRAWRRESSWLARLYSLLGIGVVGVGATIGGYLAYAHGANVNRLADLSRTGEWHDIGAAAAIPDNEPVRRAAGSQAVLVYRAGNVLRAFPAECPHHRGSLPDGEVATVNGALAIECPLHGSAFALADGGLRRGPATVDLPKLDVRTVDGRVQVRL